MQVATPKKGYKLVKTSFGKYEEIPEEWEFESLKDKIRSELKQGLEKDQILNKEDKLLIYKFYLKIYDLFLHQASISNG